jgi:hypothetical protein
MSKLRFDFSKTVEFAKRNELMYDDPFYHILGKVNKPEFWLGFPKWELLLLSVLPARAALVWYKYRGKRAWREVNKNPYCVECYLKWIKYTDNVRKMEQLLCKRKNM